MIMRTGSSKSDRCARLREPERYPGYGVSENEPNSTFTMVTNFVRSGSFSSEYLTASGSPH